jgi:hypothetical protein
MSVVVTPQDIIICEGIQSIYVSIVREDILYSPIRALLETSISLFLIPAQSLWEGGAYTLPTTVRCCGIVFFAKCHHVSTAKFAVES